jgi:hypothetical protein
MEHKKTQVFCKIYVQRIPSLEADPLRLPEQDGPQLLLVAWVAEVEGGVAGRQADVAVVLLHLPHLASGLRIRIDLMRIRIRHFF